MTRHARSPSAPAPRRPLWVLLALGGTLLASACGGGGDGGGGGDALAPLKTLDGNAPLIIGHRGLPGLYPEETRTAYEAAADAGAS
jgi:glycerophosphoryl diester phosphodiesterase